MAEERVGGSDKGHKNLRPKPSKLLVSNDI